MIQALGPGARRMDCRGRLARLDGQGAPDAAPPFACREAFHHVACNAGAQRVAVAGEPFGDITAARAANSDDTLVPVTIDLNARRRPMSIQEVSKRKRSYLAASVSLAGLVQAQLTALRGIDAIEANAFAVDLDGVAVNDRRPANDRLGMR